MRFDVPFTPDDDYPDFLAGHSQWLGSIHFSLNDPALADARQRSTQWATSDFLEGLAKLGGIPKYVLLNTRLHVPSAYFDSQRLEATAERLAFLSEKSALTGLIFADTYYLQALSDAHPDIARKLEAVPSINCLPDSPERVFSMLDTISHTHFLPPAKLVLDRSLNRDLKRLTDTVGAIKKHYPDLHVHLMANEGCLLACPFKPAHDAHIGMVVESLCGDRTFAMNREFGCIRRLLNEPGAFLASPFIRPEDVTRYEALVDGIKLCGRNKGTPFLKRVITAYGKERYSGNLLDLMDAMGDLEDKVSIPNKDIPDEYFPRVTTCDKACAPCGWCRTLAEKIITRMDPGLEKM